jgi:hypothetical protein
MKPINLSRIRNLKERKKERSEEDGMGILGKGNQLSQEVYLVKSPLELGQTTTTTPCLAPLPQVRIVS